MTSPILSQTPKDSDLWKPLSELKPTLETQEQPKIIKGSSLNQDAWRRLQKNKMAIIGLYVIIAYAVICLLAPILPIYSYKKIILDHQHLPPSLTQTAGELLYQKTETRLKKLAKKRRGEDTLNPAELQKLEGLKERINTETLVIDGQKIKVHERRYYLGTDYHGRDMLSRIIYGGQISIAIGLIGTITAMFIGIVYGAIAGYLGGKVDYIMMRVVDIMYGLPYILIVIIFMAMFGQHFLNLFFGIALVSWLNVARVVRGQVISLKNSEYVEAAKSIGASNLRIIFKHMIPNTLGIIIVFASLELPHFIMLEAFLSFLGLGISAPLASWGSLVGDAVEGLNLYPWRLFFPALAMTIFLFSMNFLGDGLRDAFDPKTKNQL